MTAGRINQVGTKIYTARRQFSSIWPRVPFKLFPKAVPIRNSPRVAVLAVHRVENFALETTQLNARKRTLSSELRRRLFG